MWCARTRFCQANSSVTPLTQTGKLSCHSVPGEDYVIGKNVANARANARANATDLPRSRFLDNLAEALWEAIKYFCLASTKHLQLSPREKQHDLAWMHGRHQMFIARRSLVYALLGTRGRTRDE
jgi:hypothetical protein